MFLITVTDWDSMGRIATKTHGRAFQTLAQSFDFLLRLQRLNRVFKKLGRVFGNGLKGFATCFNRSTRLSVSLKKVSENQVCKKHRIFIGV